MQSSVISLSAARPATKTCSQPATAAITLIGPPFALNLSIYSFRMRSSSRNETFRFYEAYRRLELYAYFAHTPLQLDVEEILETTQLRVQTYCAIQWTSMARNGLTKTLERVHATQSTIFSALHLESNDVHSVEGSHLVHAVQQPSAT